MAATADTPMIIVKIYSPENEIRRFTSSAETITYSVVHKRVNDAFHPPTSFKLMYKDDEGDDITIDTDDELQEAVALALSTAPAVLRLQLKPDAVKSGASKSAPVSMDTDGPAKSGGGPAAADEEPKQSAGAPAAPDLSHLIQNITRELPGLIGQLPEAVQRMIPHAALDVEATLNATAAAASKASQAAANATAAAASAAAAATGNAYSYASCKAPPTDPPNLEGFHPGVTCDRTEMSPIVGIRYNLVGHDYDLCEAEFQKLPDADKLKYLPIQPPMWRPKTSTEPPSSKKFADEPPAGFHPGVTCDKSGMCPIVGYRYHLIGRNYDLCQAEFDKLPLEERGQFQRMAPPVNRPRGFGGGFGGGCGSGFGGGFGGGGGGGWRCRGSREKEHPKLAARFISDVSILDGTEMTRGTRFTKIWRLKNVGEVPWPTGAKLMCVGGDSMSADLSVPLPTKEPVKVNEEVEVAVDMVAPPELGRYIGYWRLAGPHGHRKFGQRVWCHIQVVDDNAPSVLPSEVEMTRAASAPRGNATDGDDQAVAAMDASEAQPMDSEPAPASSGGELDGAAPMLPEAEATPTKTGLEAELPTADVAPLVEASPDTALKAAASTVADEDKAAVDKAAVDKTRVPEAEAEAEAEDVDSDDSAELVGSTEAEVGLAAELAAMGFIDEELVRAVIDKVGPSLEGCLDELASLSEYERLLEDLAEMGFADRTLNKSLLVRHGGCVKKTVKTLVTEAAV